jgi:hypothetical protein
MKFHSRNSLVLASALLLLASNVFGQAPAANAPAKNAPAPGMVLPAPAKNGPVAGSITAALDVGQAVDAIQLQGFDVRDKLVAEIEQRLSSSWTQLEGFKAQLSGLTEEGKMQFNAALNDATKRRGDLQTSLAASRKADQSTWDNVRPMLAADYARYAEAIARAEIGLTKTLPTPKNGSK